MKRKALSEMNLMDNFLFGSVVTYPGIGEEFSRRLLKIIFGRDFGKLHITPQKVYYGSDTGLHGTRLDVYIEEDEEALVSGDVATVYDVEPEKNNSDTSVKALPKRVRFYHAKIDTRSLRAGETYKNLQNATNHDLQEIHRMIENVKYDIGVTGDYMRLMEDEEYLRECGIREGIQQSIVNILKKRFEMTDEVNRKIYEQQDLDRLNAWLIYATEVENLNAFCEKINNIEL